MRRPCTGRPGSDTGEAIERLLAAGATLEPRNRQGRTPLHFAAEDYAGAAAIPALIEAGADPDRRDEDGNTPLHLAASYAYQDFREGLTPENRRNAGAAIDALLDAGADPTVRNAAGETPWDRARDNEALQRSDAYWRLNDARFEEPREDSSRRSPSDPPGSPGAEPPEPRRTGGPTCEIPGYPNPTDVQGLGLNWCGSNVGFQRRVFALQSAGAWCDNRYRVLVHGRAGQRPASGDQCRLRRSRCDAISGDSDVPLPCWLPAVIETLSDAGQTGMRGTRRARPRGTSFNGTRRTSV